MWKFSRCLLAIPLVLLWATGCTPGDDQAQIASFNEMARDPDRALDMLYPDGVVEPGTSTEAIRLIRDNEWTDNEFDALANMLDAAATAHRTKDDPRAELSALAATDTINLLADRDSLPNTIDDSLGHILANYIVDVGFIATIYAIPEHPEWFEFYSDLPPDADITLSSVRSVMPQVMRSQDAAEQIIDAANHVANAKVASGISPGTADPDDLAADVLFGSQLLGFVIGAATTSGNSSPAWTTTVTNSLAAIPDALPGPGTTFADYIAAQAGELGQTDAASSKPSTSATVRPSYLNIDDFEKIAGAAFTNAVGLQLCQADLLGQPTDSAPPRWFVNDQCDPDVARQHPDEFRPFVTESPEWPRAIGLGVQVGADNW